MYVYIPCLIVTDKLGEGTYGAVYLAQDRKDGSLVAIKILQNRAKVPSNNFSNTQPQVNRNPPGLALIISLFLSLYFYCN